MKRNKFTFEYETENLPYVLVKRYIPDFIITKNDGTKIYIEVKGYLRPQDRAKLIAVKEANPTIDLRIVFGADNKLNRFSKTRYSEWATKHGIPYAVKDIPKEWFNDNSSSNS